MWRLFCIFPVGIESFFSPNKIYENSRFKVSALLLLLSEAVNLFVWVDPFGWMPRALKIAVFPHVTGRGVLECWHGGATSGRV